MFPPVCPRILVTFANNNNLSNIQKTLVGRFTDEKEKEKNNTGIAKLFELHTNAMSYNPKIIKCEGINQINKVIKSCRFCLKQVWHVTSIDIL